MSTLNLLGEPGRRLTITVHGYERDESHDLYDANWLRCSVEADLGQFRGTVDASFTTHDFARFLSDLDGVMNKSTSVASFDTMEAALFIRVEVDRAGRAAVNGKLREGDVSRSELTFSFESDRSFLAKTHAELKRLVAEFPPRAEGP